LQFIFENPIFIIIIIGMITSLIKKRKSAGGSEVNQESPKEPEWKKWIDFPQTFEEGRADVTRPQREESTNTSKLAQEYYELKNPSGRQSERSNVMKTSTPNKQETSTRTVVKDEVKESVDFDLSPSKENIIDGIIWAEILGPPRAIKSHSSRSVTPRR
jgi:hypothetical protein